MKKFDPVIPGFPHMLCGADDNPDQWIPYDPDIIQKDMVRILPMLDAIPESMIDKLERYVAEGGTAVTIYMAGMVNENALSYLGGWPAGKLKDVFGVWNEEMSCLLPEGGTAAVRPDDNSQYIFLHNFAQESKTVPNTGSFTNLETGEPVTGDIEIPKQSVWILRQSE